MPEYIEKPGGDARAAKVFATECFCFGKNLAVEDFKVWLRAGGEGAEKAKKSYSMQAQGVYMIERMLAAMMSKEHVTPLEAGNMWAELRDCQEHVKALKAALDEFASAPDDPADDAETVVPPPEAAAGSASRVAKRKSLKEMKETIKTAGYGTADIFERPEIEQRYAEALDRLAEAEWMDTAGREAGAEVGAAGAGAAPKSASFQTAATLNPADVKQARRRTRPPPRGRCASSNDAGASSAAPSRRSRRRHCLVATVVGDRDTATSLANVRTGSRATSSNAPARRDKRVL
mmetsp:Transcript_13661/g.42286  ORF Transcript_13661/g.42286 Transcript_13661/m.42286 type:complete len:290 (-) Transcript_13661:912-1781(-)